MRKNVLLKNCRPNLARLRMLLCVALVTGCVACDTTPAQEEAGPSPQAGEPAPEDAGEATTNVPTPDAAESAFSSARCRFMPTLQAGHQATFVPRPATAAPASHPRRSDRSDAAQLLLHLERVSRTGGRTALDAWQEGPLNPAGNLPVGMRLADLEALPIPSHDLRYSRSFDPCAHGLAALLCWMSPVSTRLELTASGGAISRSGRSHHIGISIFPAGTLEGSRLAHEVVSHEAFRDALGRAHVDEFVYLDYLPADAELLLQRPGDGLSWRLAYQPSPWDFDSLHPESGARAVSPNEAWFALHNRAKHVYRWRLNDAAASSAEPRPFSRLADAPEVLERIEVFDNGAIVAFVDGDGRRQRFVWPADAEDWIDLRYLPGVPRVVHAQGDLLLLWYGAGDHPLERDAFMEVRRGSEVVYRRNAEFGSVGVSPDGELLTWRSHGLIYLAPLANPDDCHAASVAGRSLGWTKDNALHIISSGAAGLLLQTLRDFRLERRLLLPAPAAATAPHTIRGERWLEMQLPQRILAWDLLHLPPIHHRPPGRLHWHPDGEWAAVIRSTSLTRFDLRLEGSAATLDLDQRITNVRLPWVREAWLDGMNDLQGIGMGPPAIFLQDGSLLFGLEEGGLMRWHADGERSYLIPQSDAVSQVWRRDHLLLVTTQSALHAWSLEGSDPELIRTWHFPGAIESATHDPRSGRVWFVDRSGAHLWDASEEVATTFCTSNRLAGIDVLAGDPWLLEHERAIYEFAIECDEPGRQLHGPRFLATASQMGTREALMWSLVAGSGWSDKLLVVVDQHSGRTWELAAEGEHFASSVLPSPDGESFFVTFSDGQVRRWYFRTSRTEDVIQLSDGRGSVQLSRDGSRMWIDDPLTGLRSIPLGPTAPDLASTYPFPLRGQLTHNRR